MTNYTISSESSSPAGYRMAVRLVGILGIGCLLAATCIALLPQDILNPESKDSR